MANEVLAQLVAPSSRKPCRRAGVILFEIGYDRTSAAIGLIAKAVDAGYRLVIVLTGNRNELRRRVQLRADADLPSMSKAPGIVRLTGLEFDYGTQGSVVNGLNFEKRVPDLPLNSSKNLRGVAAHLLVVKKNRDVLWKLKSDLQAHPSAVAEIPTLIIDLDTDIAQPSSQVSRSVKSLLRALPRAQYVTYTAGPYLDRSTVDQTDFRVCAPKLPGYLGPDAFFDTYDVQAESSGAAENDFVRRVGNDEAGLLAAIDAFVLTGAMKFHRSLHAEDSLLRHILFVHASPKRDEQSALRKKLMDYWRAADYARPRGQRRLHKLFETDILPISCNREAGIELPTTFEQLAPALAAALDQIGDDPIAGDLGTGSEAMWKIVVASVGNTSESAGAGVAVVHLHHSPGPNTMLRIFDMWCGFRPHYADLNRLFIPQKSASDTDPYAHFVNFWRDRERSQSDRPERPSPRALARGLSEGDGLSKPDATSASADWMGFEPQTPDLVDELRCATTDQMRQSAVMHGSGNSVYQAGRDIVHIYVEGDAHFNRGGGPSATNSTSSSDVREPDPSEVSSSHNENRFGQRGATQQLELHQMAKIEEEIWTQLIGEFNSRIDWDRWPAFTNYILAAPAPRMLEKEYDRLRSLATWVQQRFWPPRHENLKNLINGMTSVLEDILTQFDVYSDRHPIRKDLEIVRVYKTGFHARDEYDELLDQFSHTQSLVCDLMLEATRFGNEICGVIRSEFDPRFRIREGALTVENEFATENSVRLLQPKFNSSDFRDGLPHPYRGIRKFDQVDRFTRDIFSGYRRKFDK
ncbi:hypothetical protein AB0L57_19935 [Nocardia sp. NPDC052254]|uniref:hypothetical protein n=1 Tax=Nocardia sp. NPDC052254 TaxID=3155681 RepID=UPI0034246108